MAINTSAFEASLQAKFDTTTDPKEMLLLGKALESTVGSIAVSDVNTAGATQVAAVGTAATAKIAEVDAAGAAQVTTVTNTASTHATAAAASATAAAASEAGAASAVTTALASKADTTYVDSEIASINVNNITGDVSLSDNASIQFGSSKYQTLTGQPGSNDLLYRTYANHIFKTSTGPTDNTDGTERMRIDSSGRVTMPYQPGFSATGVSPLNQFGTGANISYTLVRYNEGNHYNSSTGVFTCPVAGKYLVLHSHLTYSNSGDAFAFMKNGAVIRHSYTHTTSWNQVALTTIVACAANDTLNMKAGAVYLHSGDYGMFSIHLIS